MQNNSNEGYVIIEFKLHWVQSFTTVSAGSFHFLTVLTDFWRSDTEYISVVFIVYTCIYYYV
jgi:hypothetical protein